MVREEDIVRSFIDSGIIRGWFIREVPVGLNVYKRLFSKAFSKKELETLFRVFSRRIDLICVEDVEGPLLRPTPEEWLELRRKLKGCNVWLFEVKRVLNAEAVGEILINEYLFRKDNPEINVAGKGIICWEIGPPSSALVKDACEAYGVKVFTIKQK